MPDMDQRINFQAQENATKMIGYIKKAAEMTHTFIMADQKASKAFSAIQTQDKLIKWTVFQVFLQEYGAFINKTTLLTGVYVYQVNAEFYAEVNLQELDQQLQIMVGIVYLKGAVHAAVSETYKECLKKLLRNSGRFTDAQLNLL